MNVLLRVENQQTIEVLNLPEDSSAEGMGGTFFDGKIVTLLK